MNNEVGKLKDLPPHPNVINLIEYNWDGVCKKTSGADKDVLYVVLELAEGGDLFDYIFTVGNGFSEPVARFYFKQLISALEFMHYNTVVHRDLKLEN